MFTQETLHDVLGPHYEVLWTIGGIFVFCAIADIVRRVREKG